MLIYTYNGGGFGNAVFGEYAAILFAILFNGEVVNITEKKEIENFRNDCIHVDDAYYMLIVNAKIDNNEVIIDTTKNYFLVGYYQHDTYYVKYKKEIVNYIENHPNKMIFAAHYPKPYKTIDIVQINTEKKYDITIHIRLGDFVGLAWTMHPDSLVDVIDSLNITTYQTVCIIIKQPIKEIEEKYLAYIHSFIPNAVLEFNENPITDYNIMRNAKTLVCSCSTLSWIASFMGCENQLVYFPNYQSRWNHELYRKPHELMVYYDFQRCSEIDLWNKIGQVNYKKKILLVNGNIHHKNLYALNHYNKLEIDRVDEINDLTTIDLSKYDAVYSPCKPVVVNDYPTVSFIFGPHFSIFPEEKDMEKIAGKNSIYIQPSLWAMNAWKNMDGCKDHSFDSIPWGVDVDKFQARTERNEVFIYFKSRIPEELQVVENELKKRGITYRNFDYKHRYSEDEYRQYLSKCKYGIWVDAHESQGFALQEALASDVPLLVWNIHSMNQEYGSSYPSIPATTIPYWDERCGEYFYKQDEFIETLDRIIQKEENNLYKPREFIMENLAMEVCENKFIKLIQSQKQKI